MDPDLPNWLLATPLHDLCGRDGRGRPQRYRTECATILLDAGANISARDEDYRSTPLAWAARNDLPEMAELLLAQGAPTNLVDDEPWATPLTWATRRRHDRIAESLRATGATARANSGARELALALGAAASRRTPRIWRQVERPPVSSNETHVAGHLIDRVTAQTQVEQSRLRLPRRAADRDCK
jgi:ankyrin repeat protein